MNSAKVIKVYLLVLYSKMFIIFTENINLIINLDNVLYIEKTEDDIVINYINNKVVRIKNSIYKRDKYLYDVIIEKLQCYKQAMHDY